MSKKMYVGNINYDTTEEKLSEAFAEFGEVISVNIITDKFSGRSRGFGFVEMAEEDAAQSAMEAMNGKEVDGRTLKVNEARAQGSREGSRSGGNRRDFKRNRNH